MSREPRVHLSVSQDGMELVIHVPVQLLWKPVELAYNITNHITAREHQVLECVAQNLSNKEIAARLNITVRTVKFHIHRMLEAFEVGTRAALMYKVLAGKEKPQQVEIN